MKANELRIGNLAWNPVQEIPYQVDGYLIGLYEGRERAKMEVGLEPIPLTEEWLIKFGFRRDKIKNKWTIAGLWIDDFGTVLCDAKYGVVLKYVHQLQNLYFALTGKELTPNKTKD